MLLIPLYDVNIFEKIRCSRMTIYIRIYHQFLHVHMSSNDPLHRLISEWKVTASEMSESFISYINWCTVYSISLNIASHMAYLRHVQYIQSIQYFIKPQYLTLLIFAINIYIWAFTWSQRSYYCYSEYCSCKKMLFRPSCTYVYLIISI